MTKKLKKLKRTDLLSLTHELVKFPQRDGSEVAKKLEESVADLRSDTALSGFLFYSQAFSDFVYLRHPHISHTGRHYYTLSFCSFPWFVTIENSRIFLRPAAIPLPVFFEK
jgi:hypothetical protein